MRSLAKFLVAAVMSALLLPSTQAAASPSELLAAGRVDDAISSIKTQLKSSPNDAAAYHYLCRAYFAVGNWDEAILAGEKATALAPENSDYHFWLGRAYGEKADHAKNPFAALSLAGKVRHEFERAVQLNPNSIDARSALAEFYLDAPGVAGGGQDKAQAQAEALAKLSPEKAHYLRGRLAEKSHDSVAAEKEYRTAIEASKGNANDWLNLALFYRHANRLDDMEQAINRAAAAQIGQNEVLVEAAEILLRAGRNFAGATQMLRRYLASNLPSEKAPIFKAHYVLGTALEKQGDKPGAAQEYRAALALASNFSSAQQALQRVTR